MRYRLYTPHDFDELYAIEEVCFQPPFRFGRRLMRQLVSCSNAATWIAEDDDRACVRMTGFAIVDWARETGGVVAYIQTLEVLPDQRGQGVGAELLRRVEDSARAAGAHAIWLHVDAENTGAIRLYLANGYRCEDKQEDYYPKGRAALIFSKAFGGAPSKEG